MASFKLGIAFSKGYAFLLERLPNFSATSFNYNKLWTLWVTPVSP